MKKTFDELTQLCNEICHHCREPTCQHCNEFLEASNNGYCCDTCKCLCVLERPNNSLGDINIFSSEFKTGCGNRINAMLINEIRAMKEELVKERIQYKGMKQIQDGIIRKHEQLLTKQGILIDSMKKALLLKGISIN